MFRPPRAAGPTRQPPRRGRRRTRRVVLPPPTPPESHVHRPGVVKNNERPRDPPRSRFTYSLFSLVLSCGPLRSGELTNEVGPGGRGYMSVSGRCSEAHVPRRARTCWRILLFGALGGRCVQTSKACCKEATRLVEVFFLRRYSIFVKVFDGHASYIFFGSLGRSIYLYI